MKGILLLTVLGALADASRAEDFRSLELKRRTSEAEHTAAARRLDEFHMHSDPSGFLAAVLKEADSWAGRDEDKRVILLLSAFRRFDSLGVPKQVAGTNGFFLGSQILTVAPNLSSERAMLALSAIWNVLIVPSDEETLDSWVSRREKHLITWLDSAARARREFQPELLNSVPVFGIAPPEGSSLRQSGADPENEPNPTIREKYHELHHLRMLDNERVRKAHAINRDLPKFEQRSEILAAMLYSKPPYMLMELQEILDRHVSDERSSNIMNAVYRALPKAVAATMPRPIPKAARAKSGSQGTVAPDRSDLPAVARPSKVLEGARQQQAAQSAQVAGAAKLAPTESPAGMVAATGAVPAWAWAALGLVALAGGSVWVRTRG